MHAEIGFVREMASTLAVRRLSGVRRAPAEYALRRIDFVLREWKRTRTDADGMIAVEVEEPPLWMLSDDLTDPSFETVLMSADSLLPHHCAGPSVRSRADLLIKLWQEGDALLRAVITKSRLGYDGAIALLVRADLDTMSPPSLELACHQMNRAASAKRRLQLHAAHAASAANKHQNKAKRIRLLAARVEDTLNDMGFDAPDEAVAAAVYEPLENALLFKNCGLPRRIERAIRAAKRRAGRA